MNSASTAIADPALSATITDRFPLYYTEGASTELDRPAYVRSGSGLAWVPGGLAVIQDDANFIAVHDPGTRRTRAIMLPAGEAGLRQFDDRRGNKAYKLDLEACLTLDTGDAMVLVAFGSGSTPRRELVAMVDRWADDPPRVTVVSAPRLYQALRSATAFAGSELNIEGAIQQGNTVRLFSRGNGRPRDGRQPVNATCDLEVEGLLASLRDPRRRHPPAPTNPVPYRLGAIGGVALGFTGASVWSGTLLYAATAEVSPDATRDGPVTGSAIGVIDAGGTARWAPLTGARGEPCAVKVEGLAAAPGGGLYVVLDSDDPATPAELCSVELTGPWNEAPR